MMKKSKGFSSVLLVLILSSCIMAMLAAIEVASSYAAKSISESLTSVSGRSVLSEYNNELFDRYGLFALKKSMSFIHDKFTYYVDNSLDNSNGIVHLSLDESGIDVSNYTFETNDEILRQIMLLGYNLNSYIMDYFSNELKSKDNVVNTNEVEYILYGFENDNANHVACCAELYATRLALNFIILNMQLDVPDDTGMTPRTRMRIYMTDTEIEEKILAEATVLAYTDVKDLYSGKSVCMFDSDDESSYMNYSDYLLYFLVLVPKNIKVDRMKNVMERNINEIDKKIFSFKTACFGFDVTSCYTKRSLAPILGILNQNIYVKKSFSYN